MTPRRSHPVAALRLVLLALVVVWSVFPIALIVLASFKPGAILFDVPPALIFTPTLENYAALFTQWPEFLPDLLNSAIVTAGAALLTVMVSTLAGWSYSRHRGRWLTMSAFFMVFIRMFPPIVITLPLFPVVNTLGLNDTRLILILLYATFFTSLGTWIMKTFIDQIPRELEEAALVDGATVLQTIRLVTLPLSAAGIVASSVFVVVFAWNEFLFAFIFTTTEARTAPLILSEMLGSVTGVDWGALFAAATVQLVPVALFVVLAQKYLIAGLTAGSIKG